MNTNTCSKIHVENRLRSIWRIVYSSGIASSITVTPMLYCPLLVIANAALSCSPKQSACRYVHTYYGRNSKHIQICQNTAFRPFSCNFRAPIRCDLVGPKNYCCTNLDTLQPRHPGTVAAVISRYWKQESGNKIRSSPRKKLGAKIPNP